MDPLTALLWLFLGIFFLTAIVTLGGVIGRFNIKDEYLRKLVMSLLVEVIGCVVAFAPQAFQTLVVKPADIRATMLSNSNGWDWQFAEKNWRSRMQFREVGGKLQLVGTTYLSKGNIGSGVPIISWESEPFEVGAKQTQVSFPARRTWLPDAEKEYPDLHWEIGKAVNVELAITLEPAMQGAVKHSGSAQTWGLTMTKAYW